MRSSRRLEAEATRNLALMWRLRGVRPDFKTMADFRKDNRGCFKGVNSPRRHYTAEQLQELIGQIDARIEEHPGQREAADAATADLPAPPTAAQLQAKLATLQERRARHVGNHAPLAQTGRTELSLTAPDSCGQNRRCENSERPHG